MNYHVGRPRKPALLKKGHSENKAQLKVRDEQERKLMGKTDKLKEVPEHLDSLAKAFYQFVVREMEASGLLCDLDIFLLGELSKIVSQLCSCDEILHNDGMFLTTYDKNGNPIIKPHPTIKTQNKLRKEYLSMAGQLGLSPKSNIQLRDLNVKAEEEAQDPLLQLLKNS